MTASTNRTPITPTPRVNQRAERLERERYAKQAAYLARPRTAEEREASRRTAELMFGSDD